MKSFRRWAALALVIAVGHLAAPLPGEHATRAAEKSDKGKTEEIRPLKKGRVPRGAKGSQVFPRKEKVARVVVAPPSVPQIAPADKSEGKE